MSSDRTRLVAPLIVVRGMCRAKKIVDVLLESGDTSAMYKSGYWWDHKHERWVRDEDTLRSVSTLPHLKPMQVRKDTSAISAKRIFANRKRALSKFKAMTQGGARSALPSKHFPGRLRQSKNAQGQTVTLAVNNPDYGDYKHAL